MSTTLRLTINDYEAMIAKGAFDGIGRRLELVHGELRQMSPAGPFHFDVINFLNSWSAEVLPRSFAVIQIQGALLIGGSMPEPDVAWLKPKRYGGQRPSVDDVMLVIEVAQSSLSYDLGEKADLYAAGGIAEYWVVDLANQQLHQHRDPSSKGYGQVTVYSATSDSAEGKLAPLCRPNAFLVLDELFIDA